MCLTVIKLISLLLITAGSYPALIAQTVGHVSIFKLLSADVYEVLSFTVLPDALAPMTSAPASRWPGLGAPLGAVAVGKDASVLLLAADPLVDPLTLASPTLVLIRGVVQAQ